MWSQIYEYIDEYRNSQNRSSFFTQWNRQLSLCLKCSICANVLIEPIQTECGCRFCYRCIDDHINNVSKMCPNCDLELFRNNFIKDRAVEKEIFNLRIKCLNDECNEICMLKELRNHSDICKYRREQCHQCLQSYVHQYRQQHLTELCGKMMVTCNDCGLEMTRENHKMKHRNIEIGINNLCNNWSGTCPYKCEDNITYENIKNHLMECPNKQINCPLIDLGCDVIATANDITKHLEFNSLKHQMLMTNEIIRLRTENDNIKKSCDLINESMAQEIKSLKELNGELSKAVENCRKHQNENIENIAIIKLQINNYKKSIDDSLINNENQINFISGEFIWNIENIRQKISDARFGNQVQIISDPFYTSIPGYKLRLKVYLNGDGRGKDKYLSIYFVIVKGDYDNQISWPFRQKFSLSMVSSKSITHNITMNMKPDKNEACYGKPINESNIGAGHPEFIKLSEILNKEDYLHGTSLKLRFKADTSKF